MRAFFYIYGTWYLQILCNILYNKTFLQTGFFLLKNKVEKLDKTVRVLINALSKAGLIEFVDSKQKNKKTLKVNQAEEIENEA